MECGAITPLLFFLFCTKTKHSKKIEKKQREKVKKETKAALHRRTPQGVSMDDLRLRLIERLCRLPESQLSRVEMLLKELAAPLTGTPCTSGPAATKPLHR